MVVVLFEDCIDVVFHGEAAGAVYIVPLKVDSGVFPSFLVGGDGLVLF